MKGWLDNASEKEIEIVTNYISGNLDLTKYSKEDLCYELVKTAIASVANFAVIPMQDIYAISSEGRMNTPSTTGGINWQWRMTESQFDDKKANWLKEMSSLYGRNI